MKSFAKSDFLDVLSNNPSLQKLPVNKRGRDWFVGDVHGQLEMLTHALKAANFDGTVDRLIGVGDLVDRGWQSFDVLKLFATMPWAHCVLGNHEVMALRGFQGLNSGYVSREDWRIFLTIPQQRQAVEYISKFPIALEVPLSDGRTVGVIHAEPQPWALWSSVENAKFTDEGFHDEAEADLIACLLWSRRHFVLAERARRDPQAQSAEWNDRLRASLLLRPVEGVDLLISGHNALEDDYRPLLVTNRLYIDTGSGYEDGRLSLVNPRDGVYVQVRGTHAEQHMLPEGLDLSQFVLLPEVVEAVVKKLRSAGTLQELLYQLC